MAADDQRETERQRHDMSPETLKELYAEEEEELRKAAKKTKRSSAAVYSRIGDRVEATPTKVYIPGVGCRMRVTDQNGNVYEIGPGPRRPHTGSLPFTGLEAISDYAFKAPSSSSGGGGGGGGGNSANS